MKFHEMKGASVRKLLILKMAVYFDCVQNINIINTIKRVDGVRRKKTGVRFFVICIFTMALLAGCGGTKQGEAKRREIDFTVAEKEELPKELLEVIEKNKEQEIRMTYTDGASMYLIRGYGEQKTGGYSISVAECTEDDENVYFDTRLIGPKEQPKGKTEPSFPYLAVKIETREKEVLIE